VKQVVFDANDEPLLADFGIAVMLSANSTFLGNVSGTVPYMAPEQFEGTISTKCDQYALGCMAYELLTGEKPFSTVNQSLEAIRLV